MRESGQFVPTLILTARGHAEDVLQGFAAGADDYLTKPFELSILIARIRGLLRRREWLRAAVPAAPENRPEATPEPPADSARPSPSAKSRWTSTGWSCACASKCSR